MRNFDGQLLTATKPGELLSDTVRLVSRLDRGAVTLHLSQPEYETFLSRLRLTRSAPPVCEDATNVMEDSGLFDTGSP